jgi:hypothetical protein
MQSDIDYLKRNNKFPRHLVKLTGGSRGTVREFLMSEQIYESMVCPQNYYILKNSIFYQFLFKYQP